MNGSQADPATRRRKADRIADQVAQHLYQPVLDHQHRQLFVVHTVDFEPRPVRIARCLVDLDERAQQRQHRHRNDGRTRDLGIHPARTCNIRDQPIEPRDILADNRQQPPLLLRVVDPAQCLDCAGDRRQRILDLMADVGCEPLGRVHPRPQRPRALLERLPQLADLV